MANALLQPYTQGVQAAFSAPLYDPRYAREHRTRFRRDEVPELRLANSFYCPAGRWPCRGWVLLARKDYNQINKYATNLQLQVEDFVRPAITLSGLSVVQARCVTRGVEADASAVYLVELTDARGLLWNRWFAKGTTSQYNVRSPAYPEQFYSPSLDAGSPWTWSRMCADLWSQMPLLGTYPGLPITPASTPEGWSFPGTPAWPALTEVLDHVGCNVACDLTNASPYTVVTSGAADPALDAAQALYAGLLEDDMEWIDTGAGRVPGSVEVLFHKRYQYYGTEETIRRDSLQWASTPYYPITVSAPAFFQNAPSSTKHQMWDDFTVRFDVDGVPLPADVAAATAIANERVTQYFNDVYSGTSGFMKQLYSGVLPFKTGPQCDGVCYRMHFPADRRRRRPGAAALSERDEARRAGWVTEILRVQHGPPWPEAGP